VGRVEKQFARALQSRVIGPWHSGVRGWLAGLERWPANPDMLMAQLQAAVPTSRRALAEVVAEFQVKIGNLAGQAALYKIARAAVRAGRLPEAVQEAEEDELLSERLSRGVGWNQIARGKAMVFNLRDPALLRSLQQRGEQITGDVTASMLNDLRGKLEEYGYRQGLGPMAVAEQIEGIFPATYANRAENIARTETLVAQGIVQNETYTQNGIEQHQWAAMLDARTRAEHAAAHGQVQPMDAPFDVGGEMLMHPGDPAGSPENVCQCRCDEYPVVDGDTTLLVQPWTGGYQPLDEELGAAASAAPQVMP